jgi:hypothetical protein
VEELCRNLGNFNPPTPDFASTLPKHGIVEKLMERFFDRMWTAQVKSYAGNINSDSSSSTAGSLGSSYQRSKSSVLGNKRSRDEEDDDPLDGDDRRPGNPRPGSSRGGNGLPLNLRARFANTIQRDIMSMSIVYVPYRVGLISHACSEYTLDSPTLVTY